MAPKKGQGTPLDELGQRGIKACNVNCKVFIQRDYSEGTHVKFSNRFPPELEEKIEKEKFEYTINMINEVYNEAEKMTCSAYCEGCFACLTGYLLYCCTETHYEKCLKKASKFIIEQNERIYVPRGLLIIDPLERGLRVIEVFVCSLSC
uniref:Ras modification protein ERF4 n=1 Tax=Lynceus sp. MCZ IZ 141354 TaxID=1930659 RepID=A0A9N6ZEV5_9CRUS|nr:EOG090X0IRX [Lynceus sp. MCZ IZ 141354]